MKQIVQNPRSGQARAASRCRRPRPRRARCSCATRSPWCRRAPRRWRSTSRASSLLGKARSRPDLVRQVLRKLRQEGPLPTYRAVLNRLDAPQPLGYSCAGVVEAGRRRASSASRRATASRARARAIANHAEMRRRARESRARAFPTGVALEQAAFATLGAIALQGLRVAAPTLGEVGRRDRPRADRPARRAAAARRTAAACSASISIRRASQQALDAGRRVGRARPATTTGPGRDAATGGHGADFALVTAASESSAPIAARRRAVPHEGPRSPSVGATALDLDRRTFYEKELELRMSMSYGPGRYDRALRGGGPRLSARRTCAGPRTATCRRSSRSCAAGAVRPAALDTETVPFEDAVSAYEDLAAGTAALRSR